MGHRIGAALAAVFALFLFAGIASANVATSPTCGEITVTHAPAGWTVTLEPGDHTFGPFATDGTNGPYPIAAGTYTYTFHAASGKQEATGTVTVIACVAQPSPTHSLPRPTPRATPPATDTGIVRDQTGLWPYTLILMGMVASVIATCVRLVRRIR